MAATLRTRKWQRAAAALCGTALVVSAAPAASAQTLTEAGVPAPAAAPAPTLAAPAAQLAAAPAVRPRINPDATRALRRAVTTRGVMRHEREFQAIADRSQYLGRATRASGTPGYDLSVRYVARQMRAAGYRVSVQEFTFPFFSAGTPTLTVTPRPAGFNGATNVFTYSGSGDVTRPVTPVDVVVPIGTSPANTSTSGCEAADFAGFPRDNIALVQRGTCPFGQKVDNATAAGASAVIIFNEGQAGRTDLVAGTLGAPKTIPVLGLSYADGAALVTQARSNPATSARVAVQTVNDPARRTYNVIAESRTGNPDNVVMAGAHLDSVAEGPGINDNGSGSSALLEIARQMSKQKKLRNQVRFAWWGAEELGLLGSEYYVDNLSQDERTKVALYLNFDMVGSPNFVRFVYDGDNSAFPVGPGIAAGPAGSGQIESEFAGYFRSQRLASAETPFNGRSDYGPFIAVGIPAGGLFTGAEGIKTAEEARIYGGQAGVAYDPCYHKACDTIDNVNRRAIDQMSDAIAHVLYGFSRNTRSVDGIRRPAAARAAAHVEAHSHDKPAA